MLAGVTKVAMPQGGKRGNKCFNIGDGVGKVKRVGDVGDEFGRRMRYHGGDGGGDRLGGTDLRRKRKRKRTGSLIPC